MSKFLEAMQYLELYSRLMYGENYVNRIPRNAIVNCTDFLNKLCEYLRNSPQEDRELAIYCCRSYGLFNETEYLAMANRGCNDGIHVTGEYDYKNKKVIWYNKNGRLIG